MKKHMFWLFHLLSTVQCLYAQEFRDSIQGIYRYWDDVNQQIIGSENITVFLIKHGTKDTMDFIFKGCGDSLLIE